MTVFFANIRSMSKPIISLFGCLFLLVISGCGAKDLQSIQVTPTNVDLTTLGASQQFSVMANYTNNSSFNVANQVTYTVTSPATNVANAVTVSGTGLAENVIPACTWTMIPATGGAPATFTSTPYVVTVTFGGQTATAFVNVASTGCAHP